MKKNIRKLFLFMVILIFITGCGSDETYISSKADNITSITETQTSEKLLFSNITLVEEDNLVYILADVTNETSKAIDIQSIKLTFWNDDEQIDKIATYIGDSVGALSTTEIKVLYSGDLSKVNKIEFEVVK
ncbi:MAG: hypothetical protein PHE54_04040 [Bacilli bacterium]|nr:hypothetical protein [Bacilli bacterium]